MRLQSIEVKGFKSFADQTLITFDQDITGIVGPNGCGKSNVVDAIRWVLGEQRSSALRSEKMDNLIFNGTKKRRQAGVCEVHISFENDKGLLPLEFSTVTVSRLLYRTGESEYRINNVACRHKDIKNLFMDTGIGTNSYAIIELKMVEGLIEDRDNSRRSLFEQAAGIEKYKIRKKESLNKLKGTMADLERVEDIVYEIEGQMKSLEKQAKRAKKYREVKEEYKSLSLDLTTFKIQRIKGEYQSVESQIKEQSDLKRAIEAEISKMEASIQKEKKEVLEKEEALQKVQQALQELNNTIQSKENAKQMNSERQSYLSQRTELLKKEIDQLQERIQLLESNSKAVNSELSDADAKLEGLQIELDKISDGFGHLESELLNSKSKWEAKRTEFLTKEKEMADVEKQKAVLNTKIETLSLEIHNNQDKASIQSANLNEISSQIEQTTSKITSKQAELASLDKFQTSLLNQQEETNSMIEQLKTEMAAQSRILDAKQNEYRLIKDLVDNLEGFPESIKFLKKEVDLTKQAPLLSDIISVQEEVKVALEQYLDQYLNYYIVSNYQDASECINILQNSNKGRANFFILHEFETYQSSSPLLSSEFKSAFEFIEIEEKYSHLIDYLLDKVYFITDPFIEEASKLLSQYPDLVFLSSTGKVVRSKYAVNGGSVGLFEGKRIGRAKQLEKLKKEIKQLEDKRSKIEGKIVKAKHELEQLKLSSKQKEFQTEQQEFAKLERELSVLEARKEGVQAAIHEASGKEGAAHERLTEFQAEYAKLEIKLDTIYDQINALEDEVIAFEQDTKSKQSKFDSEKEAFNAANMSVVQQENLVKGLQKDIENKQAIISESRDAIIEKQAQYQSAQEEYETAILNLEDIDSGIGDLYSKRKQLEHSVIAAEERYFESRGGISEIDDLIREKNKKKEQFTEVLIQLENKLIQYKSQFQSIHDRLDMEFGLNINDFMDKQPNSMFEEHEVELKVEKLKTRIQNYGEINPMAEEAYTEISERYEFITKQRADLLEAKGDLELTIAEIDGTATERFVETFNQVRANFKEVFSSLFREEDDCDVIMEEPDRPLETSIDIVAKPKGKRPTTITQLSGGEKTLTATALLFSLYLIKPAPFCVFDEVDAPLDDSNVDKFVNIIRKFSKESQFIMITHKKETMAAVDAIFGVTMVEEGVSKVVPAKFSEI